MIKHFLDIDNYNELELRKILNFAKKIKKNQNKYSSILKNKSLGMLFEKQSLRTRLSFSIGMQKLGGNVLELNQDQIGFGKRESIEDILKTMSQFFDVLMIRNNDHKQMLDLASLDVIPIINGLSNNSHPCQILSDIFSIEEKIGNIREKKITWLGDFNNVLISLMQAAEVFRFQLSILTPAIYHKKFNKIFKNKSLQYSTIAQSFDSGIMNTDCVMTDAWISMGEKNNKYKKKILKRFQVSEKIMMKAKKKAIFMHCLPAHRNEEVTDSVIDGKQSIVWHQAQNRMYVQQSILHYLIK